MKPTTKSYLTFSLSIALMAVLIGSMALAGNKKAKKSCARSVAQVVDSNDDSSQGNIGPDDVSDGEERTGDSDIDGVGSEFPDRTNGGNSSSNWDGSSGAGGAWSSEF